MDERTGASEGAGTNSVHSLFSKIISKWATGDFVLDSTVDGFVPSFISYLESDNISFHFENYIHKTPPDTWKRKEIKFEKFSDGWFLFIVPSSWAEVSVDNNNFVAAVDLKGKARLSIGLTYKETWAKQLPEFLADDEDEVCAFFASPIFRPHYDRWIIVRRNRKSGVYWLWAIFNSGPYLVWAKGDAENKSDLEEQLTSMMNSNPFYGWIRAASSKSP